MRIYTKAGDLAFKVFTFPDGQPHFKLETYEREFESVTIETALRSPVELFTLSMAVHVLRAQGYSEVNVDIRYLLGARMDRAIDPAQPHTLSLVARQLNSLGLSRIRILDVHSEVATRLIRNSENVLPYSVVQQATLACTPSAWVCPDAGAVPRHAKLQNILGCVNTIYCNKKRDPETGNLAVFGLINYNPNPNADGTKVLIVDDICDGGGTFVGLAKELMKAGAKKIYLFVTHGIFSKGLPLEGIDHIYATDSYTDKHAYKNLISGLTVVPISMKELK